MSLTSVIKDSNEIIKEVADQYYRGVYKGYYLEDVYYIVVEDLIKSIKDIIDPSLYNSQLYNNLISNIEDFVTGKNITQWNKMKLALNETEDELIDFVKKSQNINYLYNDTYLKTEMNYINNSMNQVNTWNNYSKLDQNKYMIKYVATKDELTRDSHMMLNGTLLPFNDNFWMNYTPPIDYNCRCTTQAIRFDPVTMGTQISESQDLASKIGNIRDFNIPKGLVGNVSKSGLLFTDKHPYLQNKNIQEVKNTFKSK